MLLLFVFWCVFFFKQKTAYEMRISDWSSDVCSSDLLQALLNIVRNAAQALTETPPKGSARLVLRTRIGRQLLLATQQAKLGVVVSVIDNGPGVPVQLRDKIFDPLVTGRASGTGLGLSLTKEFRAEEHT